MIKRWLGNKGVSTVELLLVMSALVSIAILFKDGLMDFSENAAEKAFSEPPAVEWMTFGGES